MTDDMIAAVEAQLKTIYPTVYRFYCPQNFKTPSFLISVTDQNYARLLTGSFAGKLSLDVQYFSGAKSVDLKAIRADCASMQEVLLRRLNLAGGFRCINKDARITDNVLHVTFDIKYREGIAAADPIMENLILTIKE